MNDPTRASIALAVAFYDRHLPEHTHRAAFGMAVCYLARKEPHVSLLAAERALRAALAVRIVK